MENEFLFDDFDAQKDALPEGKSVDVFNALSLVDESLGKLYVEKDYNPYGKDFVLTEEYADEILQNKINASDLSSENFLEHSNSEISKNFTTALENSEAILNALENETYVQSDPKVKEQIQRTIVTLKNRNELLKLNITKLKQKDANALKMYIELYGMDGELGELLKDTFTEKANMQALIMQFMALIQKRAKTVYRKAQNLKDKIIDEASLKQEIDNAVAQSQAEAQNRMNAENQEEIQRQQEKEDIQEQTELKQQEENQEKEKEQNKQSSQDEEFTR